LHKNIQQAVKSWFAVCIRIEFGKIIESHWMLRIVLYKGKIKICGICLFTVKDHFVFYWKIWKWAPDSNVIRTFY